MAAIEAGSSSSSLIDDSWEPVLDQYLRKKAGAQRDLNESVFSKNLPQEVLSLYNNYVNSRRDWVLHVASHLYQYSKLDLKQTWLQSLIACEMVHDRTCFGEPLDPAGGIIIQSDKGSPHTVEYARGSSAIYVHLSQKKKWWRLKGSASSIGKGKYGSVSSLLRVTAGNCRLVANKQMSLSTEISQSEHAILQRLNGYPYIIAAFDLICHQSLSSASLMIELANQGPVSWKKVKHLPLKQRLELFQQALSALVAVHAQHIAHKDLKPDNLLLTKYRNASGEERFEVRLIDFGCAVDLSVDGPRRLRISSAYYQPFEVHRKDMLDRAGWQRADVFALGIIGIQEFLGTNPGPHDDSLNELPPATQAAHYPDSSLFWAGRKLLPSPMQLVFDGILANSSKNRLTAQVGLAAFNVAMEKID